MKKGRNEQLEAVLRDILPEAFAVVKETARRFMENEEITVTATQHDRELATKMSHVRIEGENAIWKNSWKAAGGDITWNMLHYDVQLIGGMVLHDGKVAEMATGEGKTLVATLPAYLNGVAGQGVHIITVNDYLARRDQEWVGPIFQFLLLTVDCIDKYRPNSPERREAYACDITYGTNNEFGFDYLRDNMVRTVAEKVQRQHHYTMIDEVDSVLIDDARTPLIISGPVTSGSEEQEYNELNPLVSRLIEKQRRLATDYLAQAKKLIKDGNSGVEEGEGGLALLRAYRALPKNRPLIKFLSEDGVRVILQKTENFYMGENNKRMHLVDDALFFNIDEKNRQVELLDKGAEMLSAGQDDPELFVLPDIGGVMVEIDLDESLTAEEKASAKAKAGQDFAAKSKRVHAVNQLLKAHTLFERDEEYVVMDSEVKIVDEQTGRMMEGRRYSDGLHQALEAKENVKVGEITQTYATVTLQNYFRMYHKLCGMTGTAETEAGELWEIYKLDVVVIPTNRPIVRNDGDDMVFKTAREKFNAVIDEIQRLTTAGRPVLVGTTSVDVSEVLSRLLQRRGIEHAVLNAKQHQKEAEIVAAAGNPGTVTIATNMAGRGTDIKLTAEVKASGGLAIIGTERHDSRRVDRQLRGRAGRQGDPGSSQFYVSLEDSLMRLFQSDRIAKLMDKMGHEEGEVIQHSMVSKSIERAQKKVEENNFGIRKRLLEYDDVMNIQREAIYTKRNNALTGERLAVDLNNMFQGLTETLVVSHRNGGNYETFKRASLTVLGLDPELDAGRFENGNESDAIQGFQQNFDAFYLRKENELKGILHPFIQKVKDEHGDKYRNVQVPFTDGRSRMMNIAVRIDPALESEGGTIMRDIERAVTLAVIDEKWKEHLRSMDELKTSVQSAQFEQKDPLVKYKMEAYELFEQFIYLINEEVTGFLSAGRVVVQTPEGGGAGIPQRARQVTERKQPKLQTSRGETASNDSAQQAAARRAAQGAGGQQRKKVETVRNETPKVGRNEPCPCGSGKKFKQCHGR
jgi:preprotein translocase subunit SecA